MRCGMVLLSQTRGQSEGTHLGGILALRLVNKFRADQVTLASHQAFATACAEQNDSTQTAKLYECLVDRCNA